MKRMTKITAFILAAMALCSCKSTDEDILQREFIISHEDEQGYIHYSNPDEWTYERIFNEITIDGISYEAPLTLEKLGNDFNYTELSFSEDVKGIALASGTLCYKDKALCWFSVSNCSNEASIANKPIENIIIRKDNVSERNYDTIKINGIGINSDFTDIKSRLGVPVNESSTSISYSDKELYATDEGCTLSFLGLDGKATTMIVVFGDREGW